MPIRDYASEFQNAVQKGSLEGANHAAKVAAFIDSYKMNQKVKHPILSGMSDAMMAFGQGITGQPFYTGFKNNQAEMQKQQMDMAQQMMGRNTPTSVPIIVMGADGQPKIVGEAPKGSFVRQSPEALLALAQAKNEMPTADMKNAAVTTRQARVLWDEVKAQSEGLKGGYAGMGEMGKAVMNRGKGKSGDYSLYLENLPSSAVSLYRALTGDTRLSDADAKARALPLLWNPSQDVSLRQRKNDFIDKMINSREQLLSSGKYQGGIVPLEDIKSYAEGIKTFNVNGVSYNIPSDKVDAFKKAKGL